MRIDIVVPARNEAERLPRLMAALECSLAPLGDLSWRVIVVDDGSQDGTWGWLESQALAGSRVEGVRFARSFGKEAAIVAGLTASDAEAVLVMDADLEHPPEVVPSMVELWRSGAAPIVSAVRRVRGDESTVRRWGARAFYGFFRTSTGITLEHSTDFKLMSRSVVDAYLALRERQKFFRGLTAWLGFEERRVEFDPAVARDKRSTWSLWRLIRYGVQSLLAFTSAPLLLMGLLGGATLLFSIAFGIQTFIRWSFGGSVEGFTTVILLQLILGSALMMGLAIVGGYLAMIYDEVKARPMFTVTASTRRKLDT